jgi:hypothetical protein
VGAPLARRGKGRAGRPVLPAPPDTADNVTGDGGGIITARTEHHAGPVRLASIVGVPASTIGAVVARAGLPRLAEVDRLTGELLRGRRHSDRRYERAHPGDLLHVDVMKLGRIPDGGGWRVHGRAATVDHRHKPVPIGFDYVHVAIDDHSRLAYVEVLPDERVNACAGFLTGRWPGSPPAG